MSDIDKSRDELMRKLGFVEEKTAEKKSVEVKYRLPTKAELREKIEYFASKIPANKRDRFGFADTYAIRNDKWVKVYSGRNKKD